ncbi:MAG TPA: HEAT repeat domain-containing protein [Planctomycetota bacterium]|nr:HEAT repeat domain-containing protein [Planctomycetota bacterium]
MRPGLLLAVLAALCAPGCVSATDAPAADVGPDAAARAASQLAARRAADEADFLRQLDQTLATRQKEDPATLLTTLEHLLPAWESEQRRGREEPIERIITLRVVCNLDAVLAAFEQGARERQLVAAWALGFARVPPNALGIESPHARARVALVKGLQSRDDAMLRNVLLGLWKLHDAETPLRPLLDLMVQHHDPDVRSNAALAVGAVIDDATLPAALDSLLVALADKEPKVRLHVASAAQRHPAPAFTERLLGALPTEEVPLVRASMAAALGAARSKAAAPLLLTMIDSAREIESSTAHAALVAIFGQDLGVHGADWVGVVK